MSRILHEGKMQAAPRSPQKPPDAAWTPRPTTLSLLRGPGRRKPALPDDMGCLYIERRAAHELHSHDLRGSKNALTQ